MFSPAKPRFVRVLPWLAPAIVVAALTAAEPNGEPTLLLRSPTVSATQIAFAYANNIWSVDRAGGLARRLTSFQGQTTNPQFSPDGELDRLQRRVRRQHRRLRRSVPRAANRSA